MSARSKTQDGAGVGVWIILILLLLLGAAVCLVSIGFFLLARLITRQTQKRLFRSPTEGLQEGQTEEESQRIQQGTLLRAWLVVLPALALPFAATAGIVFFSFAISAATFCVCVALPVVGAGLYRARAWLKTSFKRALEHLTPKSKRYERGLDPVEWEAARQLCFAQKGYDCYIRLPKCTRAASHIDHIVPLARGGDKYDQNNLQPACRYCNLSKGTKLMSELGGIGWNLKLGYRQRKRKAATETQAQPK